MSRFEFLRWTSSAISIFAGVMKSGAQSAAPLTDRLRYLSELRQHSLKENILELRRNGLKSKGSFHPYVRDFASSRLKEIDAQNAGVNTARISNLNYTLQEYEDWVPHVDGAASQNNQLDFGIQAWNSYKSSISFVSKSHAPSNKSNAIQAMMSDIDRRRSHQSKRRKFDEEQDYSFINLRNMKFNRKLDRAYDIYTQNIRDNLE
jgi:hypothetical protein